MCRLTFLGENNYTPAWLCGTKHCLYSYLLVLISCLDIELDTSGWCSDCIEEATESTFH